MCWKSLEGVTGPGSGDWRVTGEWTASRHSLCLSHQGGVTLDMGDYPADADADADPDADADVIKLSMIVWPLALLHSSALKYFDT